MKDLANAVIESIETQKRDFQFLYPLEQGIEQKIEIIAQKIYGAKGVIYSQKAKSDLKIIKDLGFEQLPVCIAKTQKSLSDDEKKIGRPADFDVTVRGFEFATGAGFIIPILGDIMRMPGLPEVPMAENMRIDKDGNISGLS